MSLNARGSSMLKLSSYKELVGTTSKSFGYQNEVNCRSEAKRDLKLSAIRKTNSSDVIRLQSEC